MKIICFKKLKFVPASHEDPKALGVLKKVLLKKGELIKGEIQMINWCKLATDRSFKAHHHQTMEEVFIILTGKVKIKIGDEENILEKGDAVVIPIGKVHTMENIGERKVEYIALGVALEKDGKTVVV